MYTFDDRDGKSVSLRPEGTASAVRAYVDHSQWNVEPVTRWYYVGPMFRHERAQRGRLRQFHQIGAEFFGAAEPTADAETIAMLVAMFEAFGLPAAAIDVNLNSLGEPEERAGLPRRAGEVLHAAPRQAGRRLAAAAGDQPAADPRLEVPRRGRAERERPDPARHAGRRRRRPASPRCAGTSTRWACAHALDPRLVRGLDYYTGTIFEIKTTIGELGTQNTIAGGGRYDRLVGSLGGKETPAIGFALGVERALLAMQEAAEAFEPPLAAFFAPMDAAALAYALPARAQAAHGGLRVEIEHRPGKVQDDARPRRQAARPRRRSSSAATRSPPASSRSRTWPTAPRAPSRPPTSATRSASSWTRLRRDLSGAALRSRSGSCRSGCLPAGTFPGAARVVRAETPTTDLATARPLLLCRRGRSQRVPSTASPAPLAARLRQRPPDPAVNRGSIGSDPDQAVPNSDDRVDLPEARRERSG